MSRPNLRTAGLGEDNSAWRHPDSTCAQVLLSVGNSVLPGYLIASELLLWTWYFHSLWNITVYSYVAPWHLLNDWDIYIYIYICILYYFFNNIISLEHRNSFFSSHRNSYISCVLGFYFYSQNLLLCCAIYACSSWALEWIFIE